MRPSDSSAIASRVSPSTVTVVLSSLRLSRLLPLCSRVVAGIETDIRSQPRPPMPQAARRPCKVQTCRHLTPPVCPVHGKQSDTRKESTRRETDPHRWVYSRARWAKARKRLFTRSPLCVDCTTEGKVTLATDAHHDPPLRQLDAEGRLEKDFDNLDGLVAVCVYHHRLRDRAQGTGASHSAE